MLGYGDNNKHIYSINQDVIHGLSVSPRTAYRHLKELKSLGIVNTNGSGYFTLNKSVVSQRHIIQEIIPSLKVLKAARRFGRDYDRNNSDINFAMKYIPYKSITLDYRAWELTQYQYPSVLYLYVEDVDKTALYLKENRFYGGQKGRVVLLPYSSTANNEIQRVYLDCIAKGGRSVNDAIAIHLLHGDKLKYKANFPLESILKVREELPADGITSPSN